MPLNPFHLPEICIRLQPYLDEGTLFNCILVCRAYHRVFLPALYNTLPLVIGHCHVNYYDSYDVYRKALLDKVYQRPKLLKTNWCHCSLEEDRFCVARIVRRHGRWVKDLNILNTDVLTDKWMRRAQQESCHLDRNQESIRHRRLVAKGLITTEEEEEVNHNTTRVFPQLQRLTLDTIFQSTYRPEIEASQSVKLFMEIVRGAQSTLLSLSENWAGYKRECHDQFATLFLEWLQESAALVGPSSVTLMDRPPQIGVRLAKLQLTSWKLTLETLSGMIEHCPVLKELTMVYVDILHPDSDVSPTCTLLPTSLSHEQASFLDTRQLTHLSFSDATLPTRMMEFYCPDLRILSISMRKDYCPVWEEEALSPDAAVNSRFVWTLPQINKITYDAKKWDPMGLFGAPLLDYPATALGWSRAVRSVNKYMILNKHTRDTIKAKAKKRTLEEWPKDTLCTIMFNGASLSRRQIARMVYPANHFVDLNLSWDSQLDGSGIIRILAGCRHLRRLVTAGVYFWLDENVKALEERPWVCRGLEELSILVSVSRKYTRPGGIKCPFRFQDHLQSCHTRRPVAVTAPRAPSCVPMKTRYSGKNSKRQQNNDLLHDQEKQLQGQAAIVANLLKLQKGAVQSQPLCIDHQALPFLFKRISELTKLREINLGEGYNDVTICCGLPWTLQDGLGQLAGLKEMRVFHITSWTTMMGLPEVKWMLVNWPRLSKIVLRDPNLGSNSFSSSLRQYLKFLDWDQVDVCYRNEYKTASSDSFYLSTYRNTWRHNAWAMNYLRWLH